MNFLLRSTQAAAVAAPAPAPAPAGAPERVGVPEYQTDTSHGLKTLEGLIAECSFPLNSIAEDQVADTEGVGGEDNGMAGQSSSTDGSPIVENHIDVTADEGWIIIPNRKLPDNWSEAPDIHSFHALDRGFVFPGEQVHILACLSACKQDTEIITPFKVAAVMSKNGVGQGIKKQNGNVGCENETVPGSAENSPFCQEVDQNGEYMSKDKIDPRKDISNGETLLRMEVNRRQTENLLKKFEDSYFFVRISESDKPHWEKRISVEASSKPLEAVGENYPVDGAENSKTAKNRASINALIDRGNFDAIVAGGLARSFVKCCSLSNGDTVVLLQVNIGIDFVRDSVLEIFQFEKFQGRNLTNENHLDLPSAHEDPCGELLKWLLPVDNSIPAPAQPLSATPALGSNSSIRSTSARSNFSASSSSQLFSFGHFRSYSMSSLPSNVAQPPPVATPSSRPDIDIEDWDRFPSKTFAKSSEPGIEGLLSFRGVPLEPERFSVRCGLEGIFTPGRRWRRKIEVIQPIEIHSFAADCNTDDLLCVQIKNVSPAHARDIVVFLDAITIVYEEASKGGPSLSLPIACIEAGSGHSLPNLTLRRGEEHSFILKPATSVGMTAKGHSQNSSQSSQLKAGSSSRVSAKSSEVKQNASVADRFAVLVSCRCNYTESRLFFKHSTSWRPRVSRDLMISVASEMSRKNLVSDGLVPQLPVQVLTLQASNLTSEDLTLTVLAPASFTSPPSVVSLNSSPTTPMSPFIGHSESAGRISTERQSSAMLKLSSSSHASENHRQNGESDPWPVAFSEHGMPSSNLGCTHLWLQSRVPLGCVPSQSTATIKLELLPLTDGIITLDSLQIGVKERGLTYAPEHSLKINATSSIATGII